MRTQATALVATFMQPWPGQGLNMRAGQRIQIRFDFARFRESYGLA